MKCSSPCDGGVRYRDVGCYGSTDDPSIKHYPVDDSRCSDQEMVSQNVSLINYIHLICKIFNKLFVSS